VDAYFGQGIPDELVTAEFFRDVREISDHTAANVIMDRNMDSAFARNVLASFRAAFGAVWVKDVKPGESYYTNALVVSWPLAGATEWKGKGAIYHDDRNSADRDHVKLIWGSDEE